MSKLTLLVFYLMSVNFDKKPIYLIKSSFKTTFFVADSKALIPPEHHNKLFLTTNTRTFTETYMYHNHH